MAPKEPADSSVTWPMMVIGLPRPPNATGAVFATSATVAALSGWKPIAISMTAQIAIGEPPPASDSSNAPNENAMTIAWIRRSSLIAAKARRSTAKCPVRTVKL